MYAPSPTWTIPRAGTSRRGWAIAVAALTFVAAAIAVTIEVRWLLAAEGGSWQVAAACMALGVLALLTPSSSAAVGSRIAGFAAIAVGFPAMTLTFINEPAPMPVDRVAGTDAIATAVAASELAFATADTVVLVGAHDHADALAGSALAASLGSPLLLASDMSLRSDTVKELERLGTQRAIVVGDTLRAHVERRLEWLGITASRIPGSSVVAAASIASRSSADSMLLLDPASIGPRDVAAAASAIAGGVAIVWAVPDGVPLETAAAILEAQPDRVVVPAPTSTIREHLQHLDVSVTTRLPVSHGPAATVWIASGAAPMDVAIGASAAAASGADLVVLQPDSASVQTRVPQPLSRYESVTVVGGTASISDDAVAART